MAERSPTLVYFQDRAGDWRWQIRAANGKVVADSGEGYKRRADAEAGFEIVRQAALSSAPR